MIILKYLIVLSISLLLLNACSNSNPPAKTEGDDVATHIATLPSKAILSGSGEKLQLNAQSFNSANTAIPGSVSWRSDKPDIVSVDENGVVTSAVSVGKATITAFIDDVESAPIDITVATIANGVQLLHDHDIVLPATLSDPLALPSASNTYVLELSNDQTYEIGDIIIGAGSDYFGGEVIAIVEKANSWLVTLRQLPLTELFDDLVFKENNKIEDLTPFINPHILENFNIVTLDNGDIKFTLKEDIRSRLEAANLNFRKHSNTSDSDYIYSALDEEPDPLGAFISAVFPCTYNTVSAGADYITFSAVPNEFVIKHDLDLIFDYDSNENGLEKIAVDGVIEAGINYNFNIRSQFEGVAQCEIELFTIDPTIPGMFEDLMPISIPVNVGFKIDGNLQMIAGAVGVSGFTTADILTGIECNDVECSSLFEGSATTDIGYSYSLSTEQILQDSTQLNFNYMAYSTVGLRFWGFNFANYLAGLSERHRFALPNAQIIDASFDPGYSMHSETGFIPSQDHAGLWATFQHIGLLNADAPVTIQASNLNSVELAHSPLSARLQTELSGAHYIYPHTSPYTTRFNISLIPTSENYFQLNADQSAIEESYNIKEIIIYGTSDINDVTATTNELTRFTPIPGQTEFSFELERDDLVDRNMVYSTFVNTNSGVKVSEENGNIIDLEYILIGKSKLETYDVEITGEGFSTTDAYFIGPIIVTVQKSVNGLFEPADNVTIYYNDGNRLDLIERTAVTDIDGEATFSYSVSGFSGGTSPFNPPSIAADIFIDGQLHRALFPNPNYVGDPPVCTDCPL